MANLREDLYIFFCHVSFFMIQFSTTFSHVRNSPESSPFFNVSDQNSPRFFQLYFTISLCIFDSLHSLIFLFFLALYLFFNSPLLFLLSFFLASLFPYPIFFLYLFLFSVLCFLLFVTPITPEHFLYACVILDQLQMKRRLSMINFKGQKVYFLCSMPY
jgi:hypothetical protein